MSERHWKSIVEKTGATGSLKARSNMVLFVCLDREETPTGIAVGQGSAEGMDSVVLSAGDKITDLKPGDLIMVNGRRKLQYDLIPNSREIFIVSEQHIVYTYGNVKDWPDDYNPWKKKIQTK